MCHSRTNGWNLPYFTFLRVLSFFFSHYPSFRAPNQTKMESHPTEIGNHVSNTRGILNLAQPKIKNNKRHSTETIFPQLYCTYFTMIFHHEILHSRECMNAIYLNTLHINTYDNHGKTTTGLFCARESDEPCNA